MINQFATKDLRDTIKSIKKSLRNITLNKIPSFNTHVSIGSQIDSITFLVERMIREDLHRKTS